jgi:predicted dehydrogenase
MEAMWTRFLPAMAAVRKTLAEGAIGEVRMVQADFGFRGGFDPSHRLFNPELAGGALLDVGVYPVSFATMVLGHPERVAALAEIGQTGVDEQAGMLLAYPGGAVAVLACAVRTMTARQCWILGTEGRIHLHSPWWQCQKLTVYAGGAEESLDYPLDCNGFEYQAREVMRCLRAGLSESPVLPLDESMAIMRTLDAIRGEAGVRYPMEQTDAVGH